MHNGPHGRNALVGGDPGTEAMGPEDSRSFRMFGEALRCEGRRVKQCRAVPLQWAGKTREFASNGFFA